MKFAEFVKTREWAPDLLKHPRTCELVRDMFDEPTPGFVYGSHDTVMYVTLETCDGTWNTHYTGMSERDCYPSLAVAERALWEILKWEDWGIECED